MMNWFRNMMYGRYGYDQLTLALLIASFGLSLIGRMTGATVLYYLSWAPMGWAWVRFFSRNVSARANENQKFLGAWSGIKGWFTGKRGELQARKVYRFFTCPTCHQKLRVPKGKGRVSIRCPKCGTEFIRKS